MIYICICKSKIKINTRTAKVKKIKTENYWVDAKLKIKKRVICDVSSMALRQNEKKGKCPGRRKRIVGENNMCCDKADTLVQFIHLFYLNFKWT